MQRLADKPIVHGTAALPEGPVQLQVDATPTTYKLSWRAGGDKVGKTWRLAGLQRAHLPALDRDLVRLHRRVPGLYAHAPAAAALPRPTFAWVDFEATGD